MLEKTGRRFFLRSPAGILELARNNMSVDVSDESLADARRLNDTEQSIPEIIDGYNWIRRRSGWDLASAENLVDALEAGSSRLGDALTRLATTDDIIDEQVASELGIPHFGQIRSELDRAIEALQTERLISPTASSPLLPVMRRITEGGKVDVQGYKLREEFRDLLRAIIEGSEDLYVWRLLDDDRFAADDPGHHP